MSLVIYTIGHSTRSMEQFTALLRAHSVQAIADVRTVPRSRRVPQFNEESLERELRALGFGYVHMKELGGWRRPRPDSPNTGWRNKSFRGYADYMLTPEFDAAISRLVQLAKHERIAVMCAEAVPWMCHRQLIADALTVRGIEVRHIMDSDRVTPHTLTDLARVDDSRVTYPAANFSISRHAISTARRGLFRLP